MRRPLATQVGSLGALAAALLALAGCETAPPPPLRIGLNSWPGYEFLYLAKEQGFCDDEGVQLRIVEYGSLGDCRRAFEQGQIDGMACTLVEVVLARDHARRLPQVFLVTDFSNGGDVILAQTDIEALADLHGRRVGVEIASLGVFMLSRALDGVGLALDDVVVVPLNQLEMEAALVRKQVDAVVTYPPVATRLLRADAARPLFSSSEIPGEVVDVLVLDVPVLASRGDEVAALVRAWDRAIEYAAAHPDEAHAVMAERERISPVEFRAALEGLQVLSSSDQLPLFEEGGKLEKALVRVNDVLRATGQLQGPDRCENCLNSGALKTAQRGR